jgi:hypothetical protein
MTSTAKTKGRLTTNPGHIAPRSTVYGLFCFVGTFSAVVALFFKHGPLHLFAAVGYLAECVVALRFLVEGLDQGPKTLQRLSDRAQLLMALCLVPNVAYLFVI